MSASNSIDEVLSIAAHSALRRLMTPGDPNFDQQLRNYFVSLNGDQLFDAFQRAMQEASTDWDVKAAQDPNVPRKPGAASEWVDHQLEYAKSIVLATLRPKLLEVMNGADVPKYILKGDATFWHNKLDKTSDYDNTVAALLLDATIHLSEASIFPEAEEWIRLESIVKHDVLSRAKIAFEDSDEVRNATALPLTYSECGSAIQNLVESVFNDSQLRNRGRGAHGAFRSPNAFEADTFFPVPGRGRSVDSGIKSDLEL